MVLPDVLEELRVPKLSGAGRPRVRPDVVIADRAYSSAANRGHCRSRGIKFVCPERKARLITANAKAPKVGTLPSLMRIGTKIATSSSDSSPVPSSGGALLPDLKSTPSTIGAAWSYLLCLTGLNPNKRHDLVQTN